MIQIYLARDNVQAGPYTLDEFNRLLVNGEVIGSDLMWHVGMDNWQCVADCVVGTNYMLPNAPNTPPSPATFGDNVDMRSQNRVSVAELYGKKSPTNNTQQPSKSQQPSPKISQPSQDWQGRQSLTVYRDEPAGVLARFGAVVINGVLWIMCFMPMQMALDKSGLDLEKYRSSQVGDVWQNAQTVAGEIEAIMPQNATMATALMLLGLIGIQFLMIALRGQSLGKLAFGVATVDQNSLKVSAAKNLMRTVGLLVIYMLALYLVGGLLVGVLLSVNYLMANKGLGWHDRLFDTKTIRTKTDNANKTPNQ